ncbi:MAG TPA: hypothetical protein VKT80_09605 [Chloroflexota bacterium]|nr:hypothetical protein [Chloroflexota bacterium]
MHKSDEIQVNVRAYFIQRERRLQVWNFFYWTGWFLVSIAAAIEFALFCLRRYIALN